MGINIVYAQKWTPAYRWMADKDNHKLDILNYHNSKETKQGTIKI
jgi:hypothetical protein